MKAKSLIGGLIGLALVIGGPASLALADDAPTSTPAPVDSSTAASTAPDASPATDDSTPAPPVTPQVVATLTVVPNSITLPPPTQYYAAVWAEPSLTVKYPQNLISSVTTTSTSEPTIETCNPGTPLKVQWDIYNISDGSTALLAGKILAGPDSAQDGPYLQGNYGEVVVPECPPTPQACTPSSSVSTSASANGWATEDTAPKYTNNTLEYYTPNASDKVNFYNRNVAGDSLWGIDGLGYSISGAGGPQSSYQLEIYTTGTSGYDSLVWEPYQNGYPIAGDGSVKHYTDLEAGQWWSTHSIPGDVGSSGTNQLLTTLTAIEEANPNAKLIGQAVSQGSNNAGSDYFLASSTVLCDTTTFPNVPDQPAPIITHTPATTLDCESNTQTTITTTSETDYAYDGTTNTYVAQTPIVTTDAPGVTVPLTTDQQAGCITLTITPPTHTNPTCTAPASDTLGTEAEGLKYALQPDGSRPTAGEVITLAPGATEDITVHSLADLGPTYEAVSQTFHLVGAGPDTSLCPTAVNPPSSPRVLGFTGDDTPYGMIGSIALLIIAGGGFAIWKSRRTA